MKKRYLAAVCASLLACSIVTLSISVQAETVERRVPTYSAEAFIDHVKYLASDELAGRRPGEPGIELAAEYIARQFELAGLKSVGDGGTYFQSFDVRRGKKIVRSDALLKTQGIEREWKLERDWTPLPFSDAVDVSGPLAFAGYGVQAEDYGYDDYADFDAEGKILLIFRYEPQDEDPDADFGGSDPSRHALFHTKARVAARNGAKGLLIVNPQREGLDDELYAFEEELSQRSFALPMAHITRPMAEAILKQAGLPSLENLQGKLDSERQPLSQDLNLTATLHPGIEPNMIRTRNVLGLLPGDGTTDETIVVGAHYDHLGNVKLQFNRTNDDEHIHNGADDNASGTAGVIELARSLSREGGLRRNVLFMTFSAEEMGLLGSKHFVRNPTLPLKDVRAMINLDMIGRLNQDKFVIFGTPTAEEFPELVKKAAESVDVEYRAAQGVSGNSDHAGFYREDIPFLFPFTGVHKDYHRPQDDWELIDAEGATRILALLHQVVRDVANMEDGPHFRTDDAPEDPAAAAKKTGEEHADDAQKDRMPADARAADDDEVRRPQRPRVRLGIIPDFAGGEEPGLIVDTVMDGGGAQQAGLKAGDRITKIGGHEIKDIYGYMDALRDFKPDDVVDIVYVRDGAETTAQVKLGKARPRPGRE